MKHSFDFLIDNGGDVISTWMTRVNRPSLGLRVLADPDYYLEDGFLFHAAGQFSAIMASLPESRGTSRITISSDGSCACPGSFVYSAGPFVRRLDLFDTKSGLTDLHMAGLAIAMYMVDAASLDDPTQIVYPIGLIDADALQPSFNGSVVWLPIRRSDSIATRPRQSGSANSSDSRILGAILELMHVLSAAPLVGGEPNYSDLEDFIRRVVERGHAALGTLPSRHAQFQRVIISNLLNS